MVRVKKKGQAGQAKNYITRTHAVRKLQISLPDFRRLCIFKGIYPREPRNKKKVAKNSSYATTFYYTKDIQYLLHEPLLQKFREQKALSKKIARSLGRNEVNDAARLEKYGTPKITLDHIVRERYPTFVDALRDLDDALSLLFLFANLPSTSTVPPKIIARCQRLCHEFEHYLITSRSLKKSFLSIKGIYYQATVQGQDIMWLVPYRFVQRVSGDVDYRIMGTFVEFYATLLGFVNFRLYTSIGLIYPPKFDAVADEKGGELAAFKLEGRKIGIEEPPKQLALTNGEVAQQNSAQVQKVVDAVAAAEEPQTQAAIEDADTNTDAIDKFEPAAPQADDLVQPQVTGDEAGSLFSSFAFYISREAPRNPIEFLLRAFGCKRIGWDAFLGEGAFTHDESDSRITHQIVDRPPLPETALSQTEHEYAGKIRPGMQIAGRTYIQPQWIWDCINEGRLLRPDLYAPGATLPPHLSPWVKSAKGQYDPRATLAEQEEEGEAELAEQADDDEVSESDGSEIDDGSEAEEDESSNVSVDGGMDVDVAKTDDEDEVESGEDKPPEVDDFEGFDTEELSEDEIEDTRTEHQKELEAEAAGLPFSKANDSAANSTKKLSQEAKKRSKKQRKEEEDLERRKLMLPRKKRKLFEKMQYSNNKRDAEAQKLRSKRRKLEKSSS